MSDVSGAIDTGDADLDRSNEADGPPLNADQRSPVPRVELTEVECRVLGALIEKEFLTPDIYPMTTNALVSACNQKTNRDPVVDFKPVVVDGALLALRQRQLVRRVHVQGSRSTKHRQTLGETVALDEAELAVLSVLMLRGAQTVGEVRLRTDRQHGFDDLGATEACLERLASRPLPLVEQLERQPGHKEARWQHLLGDPTAVVGAAPDRHEGATRDVAVVAPRQVAEREVAPREVAPREVAKWTTTPAADSADSAGSSASLAARVEDLETEVDLLRTQLRRLAGQLGESLD